MNNDPLIVMMLRELARRHAGPETTGWAWDCDNDIGVVWYPRSRRYRWYCKRKFISKRRAMELLGPECFRCFR